MDTIELLLRHRSIRRYTDEPVPRDNLHRAVVAGQAASTSSAVQAYCTIRVHDRDERRRLAELCGGQEKVAEAAEFLVVCGDTRRHRLAAERAGAPHVENLETFLLAVIDATLFAQNLVVALESMGYGICYIGGLRNRPEAVRDLLELPGGVLPLYGLCVGVPAETPSARPRLPVDAVLFEGRCPPEEVVLEQLDGYDRVYRDYLAARGAEPRDWSRIMADRFAAPARPDLAALYERQGARLG